MQAISPSRASFLEGLKRYMLDPYSTKAFGYEGVFRSLVCPHPVQFGLQESFVYPGFAFSQKKRFVAARHTSRSRQAARSPKRRRTKTPI